MGNEDATDEELMRQYQAGDASAFDVLYHRHSGRVYGFLKRRLERREETDEVFQQVFAKLHRCRRGYDSGYRFAQWLFVLMKTVLLDHWRIASRRVDAPLARGAEEIPAYAQAVAPEQQEILAQPPEAILAMLGPLSMEQRKAVEWRVLDEVSYQEIAERLSRSEASVRQMVSRALRKLRHGLREGEERSSR